MTDPYVRVVGQVEDMNGCPLAVGVDHDAVTLQGSLPLRFESSQAEEFMHLFVAASWEAGANAGHMKASAGQCAADCGADVHDEACQETAPAETFADLLDLARDMLGRFTKVSDGYRARAGQVQVRQWEERIGTASQQHDSNLKEGNQ